MPKSNLVKGYRALQKKKALVIAELEGKVYNMTVTFRPDLFSDRGAMYINSAEANQVNRGLANILNLEEASKLTGLNTTYQGYSYEDIKQDFLLRAANLKRNDILLAMDNMETKLATLMTPKEMREIKEADVLEELEDLLT